MRLPASASALPARTVSRARARQAQSGTPATRAPINGESKELQMRKSQTGTASTFGASRSTTHVVKTPWGAAIPKRTRAGGRPGGSSTRKPRPDPQLRGMSYPPNDPLQWPLEVPTQRSDLNLPSGNSAAKATFNNNAVNKAFQRGGYAG